EHNAGPIPASVGTIKSSAASCSRGARDCGCQVLHCSNTLCTGTADMARHEVFSEYLDVPYGYDTYSILLLPTYDWYKTNSLKDSNLLLRTFSRFGDIIGGRHLACWFYNTGRASYGRLVDIDMHAVIPANISTNDKLREFVAQQPRKPLSIEHLGIHID